MPVTLAQLRTRLERLTPSSRPETILFVVCRAGKTDDEVTGIEAGGHRVTRLPEESVEALKARAVPDGPDAPPCAVAHLLYDDLSL